MEHANAPKSVRPNSTTAWSPLKADLPPPSSSSGRRLNSVARFGKLVAVSPAMHEVFGVLESRRVRRVGGAQERNGDVRIVAATNRDLRAYVAAGKFREDLYFRLAAAVVPVPPLRDRADDLPLLVSALLESMGRGELRI